MEAAARAKREEDWEGGHEADGSRGGLGAEEGRGGLAERGRGRSRGKRRVMRTSMQIIGAILRLSRAAWSWGVRFRAFPTWFERALLHVAVRALWHEGVFGKLCSLSSFGRAAEASASLSPDR